VLERARERWGIKGRLQGETLTYSSQREVDETREERGDEDGEMRNLKAS